MNLSKSLCAVLFSMLFFTGFAGQTFAQERKRLVQNPVIGRPESIPINSPPSEIYQKSRQTLTNQIKIQTPLVKKTGSSQPINSPTNSYVNRNSYSPVFSQRLLSSIQDKFGIPYLYGSTGPSTYDCSGLVWKVFEEAGYYFDRTSARTLWQVSEPVEGDDRFKFGTLVFFNKLGHMGIVADDKGFYHASSSQGVTYSKFEGYWAKRIVGYRRLSTNKAALQPIINTGGEIKSSLK